MYTSPPSSSEIELVGNPSGPLPFQHWSASSSSAPSSLPPGLQASWCNPWKSTKTIQRLWESIKPWGSMDIHGINENPWTSVKIYRKYENLSKSIKVDAYHNKTKKFIEKQFKSVTSLKIYKHPFNSANIYPPAPFRGPSGCEGYVAICLSQVLPIIWITSWQSSFPFISNPPVCD